MDSLSDVVMHLSYSARDGGPVLRDAATAAATPHLPDSGTRILDVEEEMPQEWARFLAGDARRLELRLSRDHFAYAYGERAAVVDRVEVLVEAAGARPGTHREAEFQVDPEADCGCDAALDTTFTMVCGAPYCGLFHGYVDVAAGPVRSTRPRLLGTFDFEEPLTDVRRVFLVVHYSLRTSTAHTDAGDCGCSG